MKENIVKNGTKVILFALDTEDTSVTGVITGHWSTMDGQLMYECHYKEIMVLSIIHQVESLELLISLATFAVVLVQYSTGKLRISQNQKRAQFILCLPQYQQLQRKKVEQMQQHQLLVILTVSERTDLLYPFLDS